jgi:hypothetical protein
MTSQIRSQIQIQPPVQNLDPSQATGRAGVILKPLPVAVGYQAITQSCNPSKMEPLIFGHAR